MELTDLSDDERLALGGLIRLLIRSDGDFSEEEEKAIEAVGARLHVGAEGMWRLISASAQALPEDDEIRAAAQGVERDGVRMLILQVLREIAEPDGVADEEVALLDWLRSTWSA